MALCLCPNSETHDNSESFTAKIESFTTKMEWLLFFYFTFTPVYSVTSTTLLMDPN